MSRLRQAYLVSISTLLVLLMSSSMSAQSLLPQEEGQRVRFDAMIEMPKAYISGMCVLMFDEGLIKGSIFNEFGITAIDFTYQPVKGKVKLVSVLPMLNKWYIKRTLKKDIKQLMKSLELGDTTYVNNRRHITYIFMPSANLPEKETVDQEEIYDIPQ